MGRLDASSSLADSIAKYGCLLKGGTLLVVWYGTGELCCVCRARASNQ